MKEKIKVKGFSAPISPFHIEADRCARGMRLQVSGVVGISSFSECEMLLLTHTGKITVSGQKLFVSVYENNNVEIDGKIEAVLFKYGKN